MSEVIGNYTRVDQIYINWNYLSTIFEFDHSMVLNTVMKKEYSCGPGNEITMESFHDKGSKGPTLFLTNE